MSQQYTFSWKHYDISFTLIPASRGARDSLGGRRGCGPPLEPDEPESVEVDRIYDEIEGKEIDPCDFSEILELEEACLNFAQP